MAETLHPHVDRSAVLADPSLIGREFCSALSSATDRWLAELFAAAVDGAKGRFALLALGGYGRSELCPQSDLDLLFVYDSKRDVGSIAERLWYPLWDAKVKLGHAVRTAKEAGALASSDLKTATTMLSARVVAGDIVLGEGVSSDAVRAWTKGADRWMSGLALTIERRRREEGDVPYVLEPDLKDGNGGLRDVHALGWASAAGNSAAVAAAGALEAEHNVLLAARVALHRVTGRPGDLLALQEQDSVALAAGFESADALMAALAASARTILFESDDTWRRVRTDLHRRPGSPTSLPHALAQGITLVDGEVHLDASVRPEIDATLLVRVALAAAHARSPIDRATLQHVAEHTRTLTGRWPAGLLDEFVALLLEGHEAITVFEALDRYDLITVLIPEWSPVRAKPQRNAYHRFTVDRHLWETAANAAMLADRVSRPDLLVLGALFHDLGKGYPGDHTDVGIDLVRLIAPRLGLDTADTEVLVQMVRHHLLLPDVATRRDLSDPATIAMVAEAVGSQLVLELLAALTEADSIATGPSAWGPWKADLVHELVDRTAIALGGSSGADHDGSNGQRARRWTLFPSADVLERMGSGVTSIVIDDERVVTVAVDRPGLFSRIAGVLSLHGLDVLGARAHSDDAFPDVPAMAANEFRFTLPDRRDMNVDRLRADLEQALLGRLALDARLAERARTYRRKRATAAEPVVPKVVVANDASASATVIEVRVPDRIGVLYRITKALADIGLDIRHATVQTIGPEVVDTFYVQSAGAKVTDADYLAEIERALLHAVDSI
jgi:[protein-PII] uridylyltransferase